MKTVEHKREKYLAQNHGRPLTVPQLRQLRKTETRWGHEQNHNVHLERKRNARQRFREWMAGMR